MKPKLQCDVMVRVAWSYRDAPRPCQNSATNIVTIGGRDVQLCGHHANMIDRGVRLSLAPPTPEEAGR